MIINSVTSTPTDYLALQRVVTTPPATNDPTTNTAAVNAQIAQDAQSNATDLDTSTSDAVDAATVRATLDQRINQDLASGTLSSSDAVAVRLTLDEIDAQSIATADQTNAANSTQTDSTDAVQAGTNTAASQSAVRTVLSETVTVAGSVKTTVITYSDGTSETSTTVATPEDILQYGTAAEQEAAQATAMKYLATIEPGTLFAQLI